MVSKDKLIEFIKEPDKFKDLCPFTHKSLDEYTWLNLNNKRLKVHTSADLNNIAKKYEGEWYDSSYNFVKALDTGKVLPKDKAYSTYGGYIEDNSDFIYYETRGYWFHKDDAVKAKDTGNYIDSNTSINFSGDYYEFRESLKPPSPFYFDYTKPKKESKERRVGIEFEYGNAKNLAKAIFEDNDLREHFASVRDGSLDVDRGGVEQGYEFVSVPLTLKEAEEYIEKITNLAQKTGATVDKCCGFHVHVTGSDLNFHDVASIIKVGKNVEPQLLEYFPPHRRTNRYCRKLTERFTGFANCNDKNRAGEILYHGNRADFKSRHKESKYRDANNQRGIRYYWLNIDRMYHKRNQKHLKTIEFRIHEATHDWRKFVGFVYLCHTIVEYGKHRSKNTAESTTLSVLYKFAKPIYRKHIKYFVELDTIPEPKKEKIKREEPHVIEFNENNAFL